MKQIDGIDSYSVGGVCQKAQILAPNVISFQQIMDNAQANAVPMLFAATTFNIGARIFKKVMRRPFSQANKLIKPLGLDVRIG